MINSINVSEKTNEELIKDLEAKKAEAVASDDFEEAIKIRDQIKEIKSKETTKESESDISEKADQIEATTENHKNEMNDMKIQANEEKQDKINDLMWQLNDVPNWWKTEKSKEERMKETMEKLNKLKRGDPVNLNSEKTQVTSENQETVTENKELLDWKKRFTGSFNKLRIKIWTLYLPKIEKYRDYNDRDPSWKLNQISIEFNKVKTVEELYPLGKDFLYECLYQIQETNKKNRSYIMDSTVLKEMKTLNVYLFNNTKDQKLKSELKEIDRYIAEFSDWLQKYNSIRL